MTKIRSNPENNVGLLTYAKYIQNNYEIECNTMQCSRYQMFQINLFARFTFSTVEVLATLTSDVGRILSKMHLVQPKGNINLITGVRIAHVSKDEKNECEI